MLLVSCFDEEFQIEDLSTKLFLVFSLQIYCIMSGMKIDVKKRSGSKLLPDGIILPDNVREALME